MELGDTDKLGLLDMPELVFEMILDNLTNLSDLKRLRLTCSLANQTITEYLISHNREFFNDISTEEKMSMILNRTSSNSDPEIGGGGDGEGETLQMPCREFKFGNFDFQNHPKFQKFMELHGSTVETLWIENYPFSNLDLGFLSNFGSLKFLQLEGLWSFKEFINACKEELEIFEKIEELALNLSCEGVKTNEFPEFPKTLLKFKSLRRLSLTCVSIENHQRLFQQIPNYLKMRFGELVSEDEETVRIISANSETGIGRLFEFVLRLDLDLNVPMPNFPSTLPAVVVADIETFLFTRIRGVHTKSIGHSVSATFPMDKVAENLVSLNVDMGKFDLFDLERFEDEGNPQHQYQHRLSFFPNLRRLKLNFPNVKDLWGHGPTAMLEVASNVFRGGVYNIDDNQKTNYVLEELTLKFPHGFKRESKHAHHEARVRALVMQNANLKVLEIHNGCFDVGWICGMPHLRRLVLKDIYECRDGVETQTEEENTGLTHLTIANSNEDEQELGRINAMIHSFRNVKLKSLKLVGCKPSMETLRGLSEGRITQTLEIFLYPWDQKKDAHASDIKIMTEEQFQKFLQEHFKLME